MSFHRISHPSIRFIHQRETWPSLKSGMAAFHYWYSRYLWWCRPAQKQQGFSWGVRSITCSHPRRTRRRYYVCPNCKVRAMILYTWIPFGIATPELEEGPLPILLAPRSRQDYSHTPQRSPQEANQILKITICWIHIPHGDPFYWTLAHSFSLEY